MTQYDSIRSKYDVVKTTFFNRVEQFNFRRNVEPFSQKPNTTVIDFACGTGFYSYLLLSWGATSLVGVDISRVMLDGAISRLSATPFASRARFLQGDGFQPERFSVYGSDGFDVATGVWFLNYANNLEQLTRMFRSVSMNLKSTGVFIGVCPWPTDDVASLATSTAQPPPTGVRFEYPEELENGLGYHMHVIVETPPGSHQLAQSFDFWAYHLRKSVFEKAARLGGMQGKLEWRECVFLEEEWRKELAMCKDDSRWHSLLNNPRLSVLVVWKE